MALNRILVINMQSFGAAGFLYWRAKHGRFASFGLALEFDL